jgi:peptide/nickel transport system substrate-binding protein
MDSVGLDPGHEDDGESLKICDNIFDTLVEYQKTDTQVKPALATRWESSPDGLRWTFQLRRGVRFHDGTPVNADAVLFSLNRQRDITPAREFHDVGGPYKYWSAMNMDKIVKDIQAPDDSTVVFTLYQPNAPFLANLAMNFCAIVSPTAVRKYREDFFKHPVGSGPFRFIEWLKDDHITLERNPDYWDGAPFLEKVVFRSIPENNTRLQELLQGNLTGMDGINPDIVPTIKNDQSLVLLSQPGMNVAYMAMNCTKAPFTDARVRRAVNMAVNTKAIVQALYRGLAVQAVNPLPPVVWGYDSDIQAYPYDPEGAKKLLTEAGYPHGFSVQLWAMSGPRPYMPEPLKVAEAIQADLQKVGIRAQIQTYEWGTYLERTERGQHQMALMGWTGDNGDPDNFLYTLLDKDAAPDLAKNPPQPGQNIALYMSDAVHQKLVAAKQSTDQPTREKLYKEAERVIHDDAPWVPLVHNAQLTALKTSVHGYELHPTGKVRFRWTWLDNGGQVALTAAR